MTKRNLFGLSLAVAIVSAVFYFSGLAGRFLPVGLDYTQWSGRTHVELMPESSPEYSETHYPGPDGKDIRTDVVYRDGEIGQRLYRADHSLSSMVIKFADGKTREAAEFANDGKQIIGGFELRKDRTLLWRAIKDDKNVVDTKTYWYDGKTVFCWETRMVGKAEGSRAYYRPNGTGWLYQHLNDVSMFSSATRQIVWDADGNPTVEWAKDDAKHSAYVIFYVPGDDTPKYKQVYDAHTEQYYSEYGGQGGSYEVTELLKVIEYADDGETVAREIIMNPSPWNPTIAAVVVHAPDGTSIRYTINSGGVYGTPSELKVSKIEELDEDGNVVKTTEPKPDAVSIKMDKTWTQPIPGAVDPTTEWKAQEADPSKRHDVP